MSTEAELAEAGLVQGFIGPVDQKVKVLLDREMVQTKNMCCGANDEGYHLEAGGEDLVFSAKDVAVARRTIDVEEELAAADASEQTQEEATEQ